MRDRVADGPEDLTGDVQRFVRREPRDIGAELPGVQPVELLTGLIRFHQLQARHRGNHHAGPRPPRDRVAPHAKSAPYRAQVIVVSAAMPALAAP